jgi:hypothetical protein
LRSFIICGLMLTPPYAARSAGQALAVFDEALQHLLGQLARRHEDQHARAVARHRRAMLHQPLQQRQRKAGSFSVPVCAAAITSLPPSTAGIALACTGVGVW